MSAPDLVLPGTTGGGAPVGGSGTIGTVPKWATTTTLNNSAITQSGVDIGIGVAIPTSALHLRSDSEYAFQVAQPTTTKCASGYFTNATNTLYVGVENSIGSAIGSTVSYSGVVSAQGAYPLVLMTNASPRMTILSAGNVGIGTTSPACALDVAGTIKTAGYTVATLPAGGVGQRAYVTDATAPTYLGALVGGGAVVVPVFHNGTAWVSA